MDDNIFKAVKACEESKENLIIALLQGLTNSVEEQDSYIKKLMNDMKELEDSIYVLAGEIDSMKGST